jgi:hypothetical protein
MQANIFLPIEFELKKKIFRFGEGGGFFPLRWGLKNQNKRKQFK